MASDRVRQLSLIVTGAILPLAALTAVLIGLGFLVTHVLVSFWPFTVEDQMVRAVVATRTPAMDRVSDLVSLMAYTVGLSTVLIFVGCAMRIFYHRWRESLFLSAALLAQAVVFKTTASIVARARPPVPKLDVFPPMQSFPSGHTAAAVALYGGIAVILAMHVQTRMQKVAWWAVLLIIPVVVAVSRVYRGMHYPSDVIASFLVGLGCLWILKRAILTPAGSGWVSTS